MLAQDGAEVGALQAAVSAERARNSALKQQLSALIAAGHADLAQRSRGPEDAARQADEAPLPAPVAALEARAQAAEAALARERCGSSCSPLTTVCQAPRVYLAKGIASLLLN